MLDVHTCQTLSSDVTTASTTVDAVMTRSVVVAYESASFKDIALSMHRNRISAVPVVDGGHRVRGVVSETDLLRFLAARSSNSYSRTRVGQLTAASLMQCPAVTVESGTSVISAIRTSARMSAGHLPVVDDSGILIGLVGRADLLAIYRRDDEVIRRGVLSVLDTRRVAGVPSDDDVGVRQGIVRLGDFDVTGPGGRALIDHLARLEGVLGIDCGFDEG